MSRLPGSDRFQRKRFLRSGIVGTLSAALTVSLLTGPAWAGPAAFKPPAVPKTPSVKGKDLEPIAPKPKAKVPKWKPTPVSWPGVGTAEVGLPASATPAKRNAAALVKAGSLPVRVAPITPAPSAGRAGSTAPAEDTQSSGPSRVRVTVADHEATQQAGITGLLLSVQRTDGKAHAGSAKIEVDYSKIQDAYGANWASSLGLTLMPGCALTTPRKPECLQGTPLPTDNNAKSTTVTASVNLPATPAPSTLLKPAASRLAAPAGGTAVLLLGPAADSSEGSFKATSLSPSGSWAAGGNSGSFTWNMPITVPPAPGGLAPKVALNYSSSSIDGRTGSTNNQASWVGEGWEYNPGFIERKYASCENDKLGGNNEDVKSGDLCWKSENATMSLNGTSSELLWDASKKVWKLSNDDGSRVERIYDSPGNASGDSDSEYWKVTTTDGTQYWFGKNRLPGWTTGDEETRSVNTVTVFGNHTGEQGHETDFASSSEIQGWRWNLDYVVDPHDNAMALYYIKYGGYYAKNGKIDDPVIYTRDSVLQKISYGLRAGQVYASTPAPAQVNFTVTNRCTQATCTLDEEHATDWPDVPVYLNCKAGEQCLQASPSFWSTKRLIAIDTVARSGTAHVPVDTWTLNQSYLGTGDTTKPALGLASVTHTGKAGDLADSGALTTTFTGTLMANRVNETEGRPAINKRRLTEIINETGGKTLVTYTAQECTPTNLPTADDTNTKRCYPSWWTRDGGIDPVKDYFHKYLVYTVQDTDLTSGDGSPPKTTKYIYGPSANWARDESEFTLDEQRTWNDFRGYRTVRTLVGTGNRLRSETDYYLGMTGDKLAGGIPRVGPMVNGIPDRREHAGKVAETRTYDGEAGPVVEKTTHTPWESPENASQPVTGITDPDKENVKGPTLAPKVARYSGTVTTVASKLAANDAWQASTTTRKYDDASGLLVTEGNDGANTTEATCTVTQYVTADTTNWLIAYPSQVTTTNAKPCTAGVTTPSVTSATRTSYDGQAPGTAPKPGLALPTKTEQASKLDANSQLVWETIGQTTYDGYGRVLTAKGQDGETLTTAYTPAAAAQPTSIKVTDPKGYTSTTTYDGLRGLALTTTDANNRTTTSQYDALGRLVKGWAAGRPTTELPNATYTYRLSSTAPSTVTVKKLYEDGTWGTSVSFYDSLLRPRQTQSDSLTGAGRVVTDTYYDTYGRVVWTNAPYHEEGRVSTTITVVADNKIYNATETLYDGRGRVTASILKSLNVEKWRTTTTYGPNWQATVPPQGGTATLTVNDARGRVIERRDYKDRTPAIGDAATLYEKHTNSYDRAGKLAKVTDNAGRNAWTYTYDLRGRQTSASDPDKGITTTAYGADGRPQSTTDARGITLATTYDELGRKTSLRKDSVTGTRLAAWTYDTATGGKGLPASSYRYDGAAAYVTTILGYDNGGRATGAKVTVPSVTGEEDLAGTYTVSGTATPVSGMPATTTYSTSNGKATTALPAETLTNHYGAQDLMGLIDSNLSQVYLASAAYTPFGQLAQAVTGNGDKQVYNTFKYDTVTQQVLNSTVERDATPAAPSPRKLSNTTYSYDPAGNITRLTDDQEDGTVTDTQCFTYDWARRMTEAWTSADNCTTKPVNGTGTPDLGSVDPYWTSWTFTDTGQRATEKQHKAGPVTADTTRTHTYPTGTTAGHELQKVTSTGGTSGTDAYAYDATGNMTTKNPAVGATQTMTWDDEGKLATSTASGATTSFLYDTTGARILKREPATTTLYLPGGQELILTKATNTVTGNRYYTFPGGSAIRSSSDGRVRFLIADHHGTNTLSISATTLAYNRRKALPFGAQRGATPAFWPGQKGFVGGDIDSTTGFTHIGAREYDPTTGQFISVDPLLSLDLPQSLNGYNYANNSPITSYDPTGMREMCGAGGNSCFEQDYNTDGSDNRDQDRSTTGGNECGNDPDCNSNYSKPPTEDAIDWDVSTSGTADEIVYGLVGNAYGFASLFGSIWDADCRNGGLDNRGCDYAAEFTQDALESGINTSSDWYTVPSFFLQMIGHGKMGEGGGLARRPGRGMPLAQCFLAGTLILMADGTTKKIEEIAVGDEVLATDPESGKSGPRKVTELLPSEGYKHLNELSIETPTGVEKLTATREHPFWSPSEKKWINAGDLKPGVKLLTNEGNTVQVAGNHPFIEKTKTYNFTVDELHTYYVLAGETPVLVHNDCATTYYHYTNEAGHDGILASKSMLPSLKVNNPKDARYGDGQYVTDIKPGTRTLGQLSHAFVRVPWAGQKFTHYIEIDTRGYDVVNGRPNVFVILNDKPLDLTGRIVSSGRN
ncbi:HYD1 signature containing ADP-ribosyltransferase family protein [Streptomyces sp. NPDC006450]|uniref:HYD1 signature containing ADP-ribosyltransferase family protein n=1 Tax=Streptomyces sp. NPDC006450 TaxID=3155458 RepID=UPI0033A92A49